jgi:hypothetical protein
MTRREAAEVNNGPSRVRHLRATLIRRFSAVWLCAACLVLTCVGASYANTKSRDAHQATAPMCCFKLSIWDEERVQGFYQDPSKTGQNPLGLYDYEVNGTAYGLAVLEPDVRGVMDLRSIYGGVAAGKTLEYNDVMFDGNRSFGCPDSNSLAHRNDEGRFRRADDNTPEYDPPHGGGGVVYFGDPFDNWDPRCNEFSDSAQMVERVLGSECGEPELLSTPGDPSGGPICDPGANPTKALLSGEHKVRITCTEQASGPNGSTLYQGYAYVAIVINIVHVSPDDRKHQVKTLKGDIGKDAPLNSNPADDAITKLQHRPPTNAFQCSSSS